MRQFEPHTRKRDERPIRREQRSFYKGLISDIPINELPVGKNLDYVAIADGENVICYEKHCEGRTGTMLIDSGAVDVPSLYTGISATKSGSTITVSAGHTPDDNDIGSYFIWPTSGDHELITARNGSTYTVSRSTAQAAAVANGELRAEVNAWEWHDIHKKYILHIGQKLYYSDWDTNAWTEIYCTSPESLPNNTKSAITIRGNDAILWNSNGVFRIEIYADVPEFYKINNAMREQTIENVDETTDKVYGRRYITALARMSGNTLLNRLDSNQTISISHFCGKSCFLPDRITRTTGRRESSFKWFIRF